LVRGQHALLRGQHDLLLLVQLARCRCEMRRHDRAFRLSRAARAPRGRWGRPRCRRAGRPRRRRGGRAPGRAPCTRTLPGPERWTSWPHDGSTRARAMSGWS